MILEPYWIRVCFCSMQIERSDYPYNGYPDDDNKIDLIIETELSRLDWANAVQGFPNIAKRQARSSVVLKNQQTIVIAGLIENYKDKTTSGVPILSDIPLLGTLFKNTKVRDNKTNVLIFVTPKIIEQ